MIGEDLYVGDATTRCAYSVGQPIAIAVFNEHNGAVMSSVNEDHCLSSLSDTELISMYWNCSGTSRFSDIVFSVWCSTVSDIPTAGPAPVSNIEAIRGESVVTLTWTNSPATDFAGVSVFRDLDATLSPSDSVEVYNGISESFTDIGLTNNTTYYYMVCTYDLTGDYSTGSSVSVVKASISGL